MKGASILFIFYLIQHVWTLSEFLEKFHQKDYQLKMDRARTVRMDKTYFEIMEIKTFKYNRTQSATNWTMKFLIDVGNILFSVDVYKLDKSNDYKPFPMGFMINLCDTIESNILGLGSAYKKANWKCPLKKNVTYHMGNYIPDASLAPPFVPIGEYKAETTILHEDRNIAMSEVYVLVYRSTSLPQN